MKSLLTLDQNIIKVATQKIGQFLDYDTQVSPQHENLESKN